MKQWSEKIGINYSTFRNRIKTMTIERAINKKQVEY